MIARAKAADGAHAFRERADDEIDLLFKSGLVRQAAPVGAQDAKGMRLVDEQLKAVLLLHRDEIGQRSPVAQHRIDAFEHHELAAVIALAAAQTLVEIGGVIVAEAHQLGARQCAAVIDRGMRIGIEIDRVAGAGEPRHHAEVGLVAGGEDDAMAAVEEGCELALQIRVQRERAVGDARARGAGAEFIERLLARGDAVRIEGDAHVVVGAGKDRLAAVDHGAGG